MFIGDDIANEMTDFNERIVFMTSNNTVTNAGQRAEFMMKFCATIRVYTDGKR